MTLDSHICITRHLFNAIDNKYLLILCYECIGNTVALPKPSPPRTSNTIYLHLLWFLTWAIILVKDWTVLPLHVYCCLLGAGVVGLLCNLTVHFFCNILTFVVILSKQLHFIVAIHLYSIKKYIKIINMYGIWKYTKSYRISFIYITVSFYLAKLNFIILILKSKVISAPSTNLDLVLYKIKYDNKSSNNWVRLL